MPFKPVDMTPDASHHISASGNMVGEERHVDTTGHGNDSEANPSLYASFQSAGQRKQ
jgi:hypothetical protein